jgi:hypothetical protein
LEGAEHGAGGAAALGEVFGAAGDVEEHLRRLMGHCVGLDLAAEGVEGAESAEEGLDVGAGEEAGDIDAGEAVSSREGVRVGGGVGQGEEEGLVAG